MSVRRVCIHADRDGDPVTVDLALPAGVALGELLPVIVEMVDGRVTSNADPWWWRLDRPAGGGLDESMSLYDNGVHDGELLALTRVDAPGLGVVGLTPERAALATAEPVGEPARMLPGTICVGAVTTGAAVLASSAGSAQAMPNLLVAIVCTCIAAAVTIATGYATSPALALTSLATASGFLAVPSSPAAPNVFLAAAAALSTSLLTLRMSGRPSPTLVGCVALSLLTALVTLAAMPVVVVGATLSCASVGLLAAAPRVAVLSARLGPADPGRGSDVVADRAAAAHTILGGLVLGAAAGIASGAVTLAASVTTPTPAAPALTAVLAAVVLLRVRTYVDPSRRMFLLSSGLACIIACLRLALDAYPHYVGVAGGALVAIGLVAVRGPRLGALAARMLDRLEYGALAAVVPVSCWVADADALVGTRW